MLLQHRAISGTDQRHISDHGLTDAYAGSRVANPIRRMSGVLLRRLHGKRPGRSNAHVQKSPLRTRSGVAEARVHRNASGQADEGLQDARPHERCGSCRLADVPAGARSRQGRCVPCLTGLLARSQPSQGQPPASTKNAPACFAQKGPGRRPSPCRRRHCCRHDGLLAAAHQYCQNGWLSRLRAPSSIWAWTFGSPCSSCNLPTATLVSMTSRQRSKRRS